MRHPALLDRRQTILVIVDVQDRLVRALPGGEWIENVARLARAAAILALPAVVTEQYPEGLGPTIPSVSQVLGDHVRISKLAFSACGAEPFVAALRDRERRQVLLCGAETHVCMQQTALDLVSLGYQVHVPGDAVASRVESNRMLGLRKMERAGVLVTSTEMALFELLETAAAHDFKAVQALVK